MTPTRSPLVRLPSLERYALRRHWALLLATPFAYLLRDNLGIDRQFLGVFGFGLLLNLGGALFAHFVPSGRLARWVSLAIGLGAWATLMALTGGARSPFVAGLWFELILSAVVFRPREILLVACLGVGVLWLQQAFPGSAWQPLLLWIHTGFLLVMGGLARRWAEQGRRLSHQAVELTKQLDSLQSEVDDARAVSKLGEKVATSAHEFKSTLSTLRGFAQLLDSPLCENEFRDRSLAGLRSTIDRLEMIARGLLRADLDDATDPDWTSAAQIGHVLDEVARDVGRAHLGVRWRLSAPPGLPCIALPPTALRQIATVLMENAAEANAQGTVALKLSPSECSLQLAVEDDGAGLGSLPLHNLFRFGATTRSHGNGAGLYLSRRLVESFGGRLDASPRDRGGMRFCVTLPVHPS